MEKRYFYLRVDLESDKGIKKGLPQILDLLKKHNVKVSFYLTMGGESGLFDLIRYRKKLKTAGERKIQVFGFFEKLRIAFFPRDFVKENMRLLKRILAEGHELGIHGWKHRAWTRGIDEIDIEKHVTLSVEKFKKMFGVYPSSFSAPGFNTNKRIIKIVKDNNIKVISDLPGKGPFLVDGLVNVPITIKGNNNTPIIEYLVSKGKRDDEIIEAILKEIDKLKYAGFYIHGIYEGIEKVDMLDRLIKRLKETGREVITIKQVAKLTEGRDK